MAYIRDKRDNILCEIKKFSYNGIFMDVSSITVTVESNEPIAFGIGDYIDWDYDGMRYTLDVAAGVEKQARRNSVGNAFVYENLVFLSPLNAAKHVSFLDVVIGNPNDFLTNNAYSFYGTAWDYAKRLEANLCRVYGSGTWKVRIWTDGTCYDATSATGIDTGAWENKLIDVSNIDCLAGFGQIYELWGAGYVYFIEGGVNYVDFYDNFEQYAKAWKEGNSDKIFEYGKGNGLYKIRHTPDADHEIVTRLRAFGSQENLPPNYYLNSPDYHVDGNESSELAITNLMLPASQWTKDGVKSPGNAYLEQNVNLYGVREKSVVWDGSDSDLGAIRPSIYGLTIADLLRLMPSGTAWRPKTDKWPDTSQRIDKIVTGAQPTDNGAITEAGFDFTYTEDYGALSAQALPVYGAYKDIAFTGLTMSRTPSVGYTAEYRIVPTGSSTRAVSFDVQDIIAADIRNVSGYIIVFVGGTMAMDAIPCKVTSETISNTVDGITYTKRFHLHLIDPSDAEIVFSTMQTGDVTFEFRAHIEFPEGFTTGYPVICNEHGVPFDLIRGNKSIDKTFSVTIPQLGFDLRAAISGESYLCMRSGDCQPREFPIMSVGYNEGTDTWYIRCKRVLDESTSTYFPNHDLDIAVGDEYYITGIAMPSLYVEIAAQKLLDAARAWLEYHSKPRMLSSVDIDNKIMAAEEIVLKEGMALPITDTDLDITPETQESRIIDSIQIEEGSEAIRTFTVTLRDKKEKSALDAAIRGATSGLASNSSVSKAINAAASPGTHDSLTGRDMPNQHPISAITGLEEAIAAASFFELDGNGNVKLKDQYGGLWTDSWMASGGIGTPGGGGGGATYLNDLSDVSAPNPATNDLLRWNGTAWVNVPQSEIAPSISFSDLNSHPTTLVGYGIEDAYTKNQVDGLLANIDLSDYATTSALNEAIAGVNVLDDITTEQNGIVEFVWANGDSIKVDFNHEHSNYVPITRTINGLSLAENRTFYVGKTAIQGTSQSQALEGILSVKETSASSLFEWEPNAGGTGVGAWRFHGNLYADGWIASGGIGSGSGGGGGASSLYDLPEVGVDDPLTGEFFYYNGTEWVNMPIKTINNNSLIGSGNITISGGGGGSISPATASSLGGVLVGSVIATPTINAITSQSGRYYYLQTDSNGLAFVNVPWEAGSGGGDSVSWGTYSASAHTIELNVNGTSYVLCENGYSAGGGVSSESDPVFTESPAHSLDTTHVNLLMNDGYALVGGANTYNFLVNTLRFTVGTGSIGAEMYSLRPRLTWTCTYDNPATMGQTITETKYLAYRDEIPTSLKCPQSLTFTDGTTDVQYDGSAARTINAATLGAVTVTGDQNVGGVKTFTSGITLSSANIVPAANDTCSVGSSTARFGDFYGVDINLSGDLTIGGNIVPASDLGSSLGNGNARFANGHIQTLGTTTVYLKNSQGGNSGLFSASGGWMAIRVGSDVNTSGSYKQINFHETYGFYPDSAGVNLGYTGANNRWANIYGVNADLSGDLALASTSHIDIGPIRIEYANNALHITKAVSSDTTEYGIYADGWVAAGGVGTVATYEIQTNKVTSLSSSSTDDQYPSAKCVYDLVGNVETLLAAI